MSKMPPQRPGKSEQSVETPDEFLFALSDRLGSLFTFDLAASEENTKVDDYYSEADDALVQEWHGIGGWLWCNPPYANLEPWVAKASIEAEKGATIAMLVPASVGSNWWATYVHPRAYVTFLNGRITFEGHSSPYPKDLAVLLYAPFLGGGSCVWRWK